MICFLALPLFASASDVPKPQKACQIWSVKLPYGDTGTWSFTEGHNPGTMTGEGSSSGSYGTSYSLTATVTPMHKIFVERRNASDGNSCDYNGIQIGNQITGNTICTANTSSPMAWSAVVSQC